MNEIKKCVLVITVVALVTPRVSRAQEPGRFLMDKASDSEQAATSANGLSQTGVSKNSQKSLDDAENGTPLRIRDGNNFVLPDGTTKTILTPQEFLDYLGNLPPDSRVSDPPRNKLDIIDTETWAGLTPEQRRDFEVYQRITRIVRWIEMVPIYENRSVTVYPCCCTRTISVLIRYDPVWRQRVTVSEPVLVGVNYPTTEVYVERTLRYVDGNPQYSTRVPKLCRFHYGDNMPVFPVIPVKTDINDIVDTSTISQTIQDGNTTLIYSGDGSYKIPLGNGDLTNGLDVGELRDSGNGLNSFSGNLAEVDDGVFLTPRDEAEDDPNRSFREELSQ